MQTIDRVTRNGNGHISKPSIDRLPPNSPEAEEGTLGSVLLNPNETLPELIARAGKAGSKIFYNLRHQVIFDALVELFAHREAIDLITLQQHLKDNKLLEQVGGIEYLSTLPDATPSAANLSYYLDIVHEKFLLRQMIKACTEAVCRIYEHEGEVDELLDSVEREVLAVRTFRIGNNVKSIKELVKGAVLDFQTAIERQCLVDGIPTGFIDLDSMTGGMHPGEMIVVSGMTSHGKSSFALNMVEHAAIDHQISVGVFTLEMTAEELTKRCICSRARVNLRGIRKGEVGERELNALLNASGSVSKSAIYFDDTSGLGIMELTARARRMVQKYGIKLLVVDYLQLLHGLNRRYGSRQEELEDISRGIKTTAKELGLPVVVLSQLNDAGKLYGSRTIGHDGDSVWRLQSKKGSKVDSSSAAVPVTLKVLKSRNGPTGDVELTFLKTITRFESAAKYEPDEPEAQGNLLTD